MNFGSGSAAINLLVSPSTPIGETVYTDRRWAPRVAYRCSASYHQRGLSMNPALGWPTGGDATTTFPLGKSGLSFRIRNTWNNYIPETELRFNDPESDAMPEGNYTLEIIKSAELQSNVVVPAGYLGRHFADDVTLATFNLSNSIVVSAPSCQAPSVSVNMGDDYQLGDFSKPGATPQTIKFNIVLNQCQAGIQKVTYQLKANTPVIDSQKGVVALNAGSTAKGIGLQLKNEAGEPIALDTTYRFSGFKPSGTEFKIPLSAAYIRLADSRLEAGTANTEVTFTMNYL